MKVPRQSVPIETAAAEKLVQDTLSAEIAGKVQGILRRKGMTQKEFARCLGKTETEVSRWLSGTHNLTLATIAKMTVALGQEIIAPVQSSSAHKGPASGYRRPSSPADGSIDGNRQYLSDSSEPDE